MVKTSDLRVRDVINVLDGKRLGNSIDLDVDLEQGRVTALVIPGPARFFGLFGRDRDLIIPWDNIIKIGVDVILVEVDNYASVKTSGVRGGRSRFQGIVRGPWSEDLPV